MSESALRSLVRENEVEGSICLSGDWQVSLLRQRNALFRKEVAQMRPLLLAATIGPLVAILVGFFVTFNPLFLIGDAFGVWMLRHPARTLFHQLADEESLVPGFLIMLGIVGSYLGCYWSSVLLGALLGPRADLPYSALVLLLLLLGVVSLEQRRSDRNGGGR